MRSVFFIFLVSSWLFSHGANGKARTLKFEVTGDSLSTGFLSDKSIEDQLEKRQFEAIKINFLENKFTNLIRRPAARRPFDSFDAPDKAWPAQLVRLVKDADAKRGLDRSVLLDNRAMSGARSEQLEYQLVEGDRAADQKVMAFFFIGANDLSKYRKNAKRLLAQFEKNYHGALAEWDASHEKAMAFIVPVPDIPEVYETLSLELMENHKEKLVSCEEVWTKFMPYWRFFPGKRKIDEAGVEELKSNIGDMNRFLDETVKNWKSKNGNQTVFFANLFKEKVKARYFSCDCLHLSEQGQAELAQRILALIRPYLFT